ncbi:MAG TPA: GNAT family N-acetyltransferase [Polyangiaceae bacterium]|nr:GNAT family N-acetyltransferase [Polyangiaceae bacterium]
MAGPFAHDTGVQLGRFNSALDWSSFDCGRGDLNEFVRDDAARLEQRDVTRVYMAIVDNVPIGYVALLADTIVLKTGESKKLDLVHGDSKSIPALKVGRLGVDQKSHERFAGVGKTLMWMAYQTAIGARETLGCRLLTVDAVHDDTHDAVGYYEHLGFIRNKSTPAGEVCPLCRKLLDRCPHCAADFPQGEASYVEVPGRTVSMRFDLRLDPLPPWAVQPQLAERSSTLESTSQK